MRKIVGHAVTSRGVNSRDRPRLLITTSRLHLNRMEEKRKLLVAFEIKLRWNGGASYRRAQLTYNMT